jgi:hypothetical protein
VQAATTNKARLSVLVAGTEDAMVAVVAALGDVFDYKFASSLDDALSLVGTVALIICNVRFDDSRMFDFVRHVRARDAGQAVPIVCFRLPDRALSKAGHDAIEQAVSLFERVSFVDLYSIQTIRGKDAALLQLRDAVLGTALETSRL